MKTVPGNGPNKQQSSNSNGSRYEKLFSNHQRHRKNARHFEVNRLARAH